MKQDVFVYNFTRTPFGKMNGMLKFHDGPSLGALTIDALLERSQVPVESIDAVYAGVGMVASGVLAPVRRAVLQSRLQDSIPSFAVDRACCSGMTAVSLAAKDIWSETAEGVICGGFESLSNTPLMLPRQAVAGVGDIIVDDPLVFRSPVQGMYIAQYSSKEAVASGVDRSQQDAWALQSHERFFSAQNKGYFESEQFAIEAPQVSHKGTTKTRFEMDENPRADTSFEKLASLNTVRDSETITAGNAPGLSDGAAFLLVGSREFGQKHGLKPCAKILDYVQVAGAATSGTSTPGLGIQKLLDRNDLTLNQLRAIEINEAYAATPLVSSLVLCDQDTRAAEVLRERINVSGGAVAIGHPLGASGARITMTLINQLIRSGGGRGAAAICGGYGQGDALYLETVD